MNRVVLDPLRIAPSTLERFAPTAFTTVGLVLVLVLSLLGGTPPAQASPDGASDLSPSDPQSAHNGQLPTSSLRRSGGVLLSPEAAASFELMLEAARADGVVVAATDGYRSYPQQVELKRRKGWLAARPGTSMHGWGLAIDFDMRVTDFDWLRRHAAEYGWIHPAWAQPDGSKPEPWHWEYVGLEGAQHLNPSGPQTWEPGELMAEARFESFDGAAGDWFDIREGPGDLAEGPHHYVGTAGPGALGNFAIAGFKRDHGGPLRGLDRLRLGDLIRVRTPDHEVHLYVVVERADLGAEDGWAVGPDPRSSGATRMMTVTTAARDGGLTVVWARRG